VADRHSGRFPSLLEEVASRKRLRRLSQPGRQQISGAPGASHRLNRAPLENCQPVAGAGECEEETEAMGDAAGRETAIFAFRRSLRAGPQRSGRP